MLGVFLEFVAAFVATFLCLGALIFVIRLCLPGEEHWNRKWNKYYTTDEEENKRKEKDRLDRWKKF